MSEVLGSDDSLLLTAESIQENTGFELVLSFLGADLDKPTTEALESEIEDQIGYYEWLLKDEKKVRLFFYSNGERKNHLGLFVRRSF